MAGWTLTATFIIDKEGWVYMNDSHKDINNINNYQYIIDIKIILFFCL